MKINEKHYRAVWMKNRVVYAIDQTLLPFQFKIYESKDYRDSAKLISSMLIRGAGTIGAVAGFAMAQAAHEAPAKNYGKFLATAREEIEKTRPTAYDLWNSTELVYKAALKSKEQAVRKAQEIADQYVLSAKKIGREGERLIEENDGILTHCNAGWLALVDYGSALAPVYMAKRNGKEPFVYVDETRPRNQGASLTAYELKHENVNHSVIVDSAAAYYMAKGEISMVIVGADRIVANGDIANKIGTLDKAVAANYYNIPFYVAAPLSTFDIDSDTGDDIPIEERHKNEVIYCKGQGTTDEVENVRIVSPGSNVLNPAFDITPASLISGIITERGIIKANENDIAILFE